MSQLEFLLNIHGNASAADSAPAVACRSAYRAAVAAANAASGAVPLSTESNMKLGVFLLWSNSARSN